MKYYCSSCIAWNISKGKVRPAGEIYGSDCDMNSVRPFKNNGVCAVCGKEGQVAVHSDMDKIQRGEPLPRDRDC